MDNVPNSTMAEMFMVLGCSIPGFLLISFTN